MSVNKPNSEPSLIYLGLGSNIGDSRAYLKQAIQAILEIQGVEQCGLSSLYRTPAWGKTDQPDFYNCVLAIKTNLCPHTLLSKCQGIEQACQRTREQHWGPRTLDIDILWVNDHALISPNLIVPHPYLFQRAFVLVPLAEIDTRFHSAIHRLPTADVTSITRQDWSD